MGGEMLLHLGQGLARIGGKNLQQIAGHGGFHLAGAMGNVGFALRCGGDFGPKLAFVFAVILRNAPRNQGAQLTAWELNSHGISHDLIVDNAGGHLMQHGEVDMVIVGTDRTTARGDVCNKIGTYLKALAARANQVPFYVALPSPTIDWRVRDGIREIPIEERGATEVTMVQGRAADGAILSVQISPDGTSARNPAFDVTPAELVTGLLTERGLCPASEAGMAAMFADLKAAVAVQASDDSERAAGLVY